MCVCVCVCLRVCVCVSVCVFVCGSLVASDSSETIEVIIIKLGMVTASDTVTRITCSFILTLTFIQGHTELNNENKNIFDYFAILNKGPAVNVD